MRRIFVRFASALAIVGLVASPAFAGKSPTEINAEIDANFADNKQGLITEAVLRATLKDIAAAQTSLYYLVSTCAANQWVNGFAVTGAPTCTRPSFSNLSGSISAGQMIAPGVGTLGGVYSSSAGSNQFATGIDTTGAVAYAQPSFSNLSGTIGAAQLIAPGASTFGAVKSSSSPANQFANGINTSGVVTYAQPAFSNLSGSIAASQLIAPGASTLGGVKSSSAPSNQFATGIDTSGGVTYAQPTFSNLSGSIVAAQLPAFAGGACTTTAGSVVISCATLLATANTWSAAQTITGTGSGGVFAPFFNVNVSESYTAGAGFFIGSSYSCQRTGGTGYRECIHLEQSATNAAVGEPIVGFTSIGHLKSTSSGQAFGINGYAWVDSTAATTAEASGGEFNVDVRAATITRKTGVQIVDVATSVGVGSTYDAATWIGAQTGAAGFGKGLEFSFGGGAAPVKSTGSIISGSGFTVVNGIDFSALGFTGALIKSSNASIDGQGNVIAPTFISVGTVPTITGSGTCTLGTVVGGKTAGRFPVTAGCAIGQTYTVTLSASFNGWNCRFNDRTTSGVVFQQTSDSATTAVLTVRSVAVANSDIIDFVCTGY